MPTTPMNGASPTPSWCMFALGKSRPKLLFDAMEAAIKDDDLEELRELLALDGADANAGSEQGMTLLHLACRGSVEQGRHDVSRDAEAFVRLLLEKGANNFDIKDQYGDRSVDTAVANGLSLRRAAPRRRRAGASVGEGNGPFDLAAGRGM